HPSSDRNRINRPEGRLLGQIAASVRCVASAENDPKIPVALLVAGGSAMLNNKRRRSRRASAPLLIPSISANSYEWHLILLSLFLFPPLPSYPSGDHSRLSFLPFFSSSSYRGR